MLHSRIFLEDRGYREEHFTTCEGDRHGSLLFTWLHCTWPAVFLPTAGHVPGVLSNSDLCRPLLVQFCANDPATLLAAAKLAQDRADAIDLNLGCPQRIARRGRYGMLDSQPLPVAPAPTLPQASLQRRMPVQGQSIIPCLADSAAPPILERVQCRHAEALMPGAGAFLMDDLPLVERIVRTCAEGLDVPVTCKIRVFPELHRTIEYARMLERAGASLIAVHGRLREQKKSKGADADWDAIRVRPWSGHTPATGMCLLGLRCTLAAVAHTPSLLRPPAGMSGLAASIRRSGGD